MVLTIKFSVQRFAVLWTFESLTLPSYVIISLSSHNTYIKFSFQRFIVLECLKAFSLFCNYVTRATTKSVSSYMSARSRDHAEGTVVKKTHQVWRWWFLCPVICDEVVEALLYWHPPARTDNEKKQHYETHILLSVLIA